MRHLLRGACALRQECLDGLAEDLVPLMAERRRDLRIDMRDRATRIDGDDPFISGGATAPDRNEGRTLREWRDSAA